MSGREFTPGDRVSWVSWESGNTRLDYGAVTMVEHTMSRFSPELTIAVDSGGVERLLVGLHFPRVVDAVSELGRLVR